MKTIYQDSISIALALLGAIVAFAKLNSYSWWLIGSWKGALAVMAVIGLAIMLLNVREIFRMNDGAAVAEFSAWTLAGLVTIASLLVETTKAEFIWSIILIGVAWGTQFAAQTWRTSGNRRNRYIPVS